MDKVWVGIDVGVTGAISVVDNERVLWAHDMPTELVKSGKKHKNRISAFLFSQLMKSIVEDYDVQEITVERVASRPAQGVTSVFSFGDSFGVVRGVLASLELRFDYVTPQSWKKQFCLTGKEKDVARTIAQSIYPQCGWLKRKKDVDRADAILIGRYGMIKHFSLAKSGF